ncbi:MAG: twin-arginine translocase TatA/TatE family subunit [Acidobacteriota bacterium]|nr:twin-arginine translocase TatA/TatE family subunit [Acidobacteriota bacterium]
MNALLFLEFLGTSELLMIAVVALLLFGPRKLPEISRTLGKSLAEFKRASDDFKRTWEYEVELERRKPSLDSAEEPRADAGETAEQPAGASAWGATTSGVTAEELMNRAGRARQESRTVARDSNVAEKGANEGDGVANESVAGGVLAEGPAASMAGGSAVTDEQDQGDLELNAS